MKKSILVLVALLIAFAPVYAQDANKEAKKAEVKSHLKQHFKPYGFIRNYFTYDSRESISGTGDLYNYQPKDENWNVATQAEADVLGVERQDLNAVSTFRFLSMTTRVGLNIVGYKWRNTEFGGKIEADFYTGLSAKGTGTHSLSGVAQFRLRQAYVTLGWDSLKMGKDFARVDLLLGQAWHPMAADLCDAIALNSGAPFGPFSRTPQVKMDARLGKYFTLTGALIWQMQYNSTGPDGQSAEYIAYSKTPEAYLGLNFHTSDFLLRVGADVLSICPRHKGSVLAKDGITSVDVKVKDRLTTASPFLYLQYKKGEFSIKAKTIFAEAGEHMNLNGGYGVKKINADGSWEYTPTRNSSSWISLVYGGKVGKQEDKHPQKLQGILFAGYIHNFGTKEALATKADGSIFGYFTPRPSNMNQMYRLSPTILWTIGKFQLGCEYEITSVQYGKGLDTHGLAQNDLHWVTNHRVQLMTKYNF
jgi:hypothetical protein